MTNRLSINQWTCKTTGFDDFVAACIDSGIASVGLWRQNVAEVGLDVAGKRIADAGLRVSSLCRGGFFTASSEGDRAAALEDNRRAIDEAAYLGAPTLILVVGGLENGDRDLIGARERVAENIATLAPYAEEAGVTLAIEALHPMFAADRAVVSTLNQALDIAEQTDSPAVGVVVDAYHVWWDPEILPAIARAGRLGRLLSYQVCDWNLPLAAEPLNSRGYMGDGCIDFETLTAAVSAAGYAGDIEVEIFNEDVWATPPEEAIGIVAERFRRLVEPFATPVAIA